MFIHFSFTLQQAYQYTVDPKNIQVKLVALSVMSAADTLGHRDVHGLSATDSCPRQWICVRTMPKDVGMLSQLVFETAPCMSVHGDNTTPISNDSVA